jgi:hypothetical protein
MFLCDRSCDSTLRSQSLSAAQMARIAFVVAFASTVDAFRPVSYGSFVPALRLSREVGLRPNLGLQKHSMKSSSVLGLRAAATNPLTDNLEKAFNEPSAPHSRELMYDIAQARHNHL